MSRDVVFEENVAWDWKKNKTKECLDVLVCDDNNEEKKNDKVGPEEGDDSVGGDDSRSLEESNTKSLSERPERQHTTPTWMSDYVSGKGFSEEEEVALMMSEDDPVTYQEVVKHKNWMKWRKKSIQSKRMIHGVYVIYQQVSN